MSKFLSALVLRSGEVITSDYTDSHEDLILSLGLRDTGDNTFAGRSFVRVEFSPADWDSAGDLSTWVFHIDEASTPEWFEDIRASVWDTLKARAERCLVRDAQNTILGGKLVFLPGSSVNKVVGGRILHIAKGANLRGADLSCANLRSADLEGANLEGANLRSADLEGADLEGADLSSANLRGADLSCANFSDADLEGADLEGADLSCANFSDANLRGANLEGANLRGADLRSADLSCANFSDADLRGADLRSADLEGAIGVQK